MSYLSRWITSIRKACTEFKEGFSSEKLSKDDHTLLKNSELKYINHIDQILIEFISRAIAELDDDAGFEQRLSRVTDLIEQSGLPEGMLNDFLEVLSSINDRSFNLLVERARIYLDSKLEFTPDKSPKNIVFSGGGAKGFMYASVIDALSHVKYGPYESIIDRIESVSGASAGALMALPLAVGYGSKDIKRLISEYNHALFLQESTINKNRFRKLKESAYGYMLAHGSSKLSSKILGAGVALAGGIASRFKMKHVMEDIEHNSDLECYGLEMDFYSRMAEIFCDLYNLEYDTLEDALEYFASCTETELRDFFLFDWDEEMFVSDMIKMQGDGVKIEFDPKNSYPTRRVLLDFVRCSCRNRDRIEVFLEDIISDGIRDNLGMHYGDALSHLYPHLPRHARHDAIRKITFKEFEVLRTLYPEHPFKDLNVAITEILNREGDSLKPHLVNADHSEFSNMGLAVACRISMNLPIIFESYKYHDRLFTDGGLTTNTPRHAYSHEPASNTMICVFMSEENVRKDNSVRSGYTPNSTFVQRLLSHTRDVGVTGTSKIIRLLSGHYNSLTRSFNANPIVALFENEIKKRNSLYTPFSEEDRYRTHYVTCDINMVDFNYAHSNASAFESQYEKVRQSTIDFIRGYKYMGISIPRDVETRFLEHRHQLLMEKKMLLDPDYVDNMNYMNMPSEFKEKAVRDISGEQSYRRKMGYEDNYGM